MLLNVFFLFNFIYVFNHLLMIIYLASNNITINKNINQINKYNTFIMIKK